MQSAQFELHAQIEDRHWWFVARRQIMQSLIEQVLPPDGNSTVVDVGCGTGGNLATLADSYQCIGIDASADAIHLARGKFPGVEFIQGLAPEDLENRVAQTKMFLLMDVLEHVPDDFELLSKLFAASSPGTYFLITVPADMALWSQHDVSFGHYRRYDRARFERVWKDMPARPLLVSYYNARLYPIVRAIRTKNRLLSRSQGEAGTDFDIPSPRINKTLQRIFAGESKKLVNVLRGKKKHGYGRGVSLVALLQRQAGEAPTLQKPGDVTPDFFDPQEPSNEEALVTAI
ncbi:MAG: class I SAM-dependent methyltransferase [Pirellulales bacterium]|nr:class I SAM-dependent methyltransferase [Pirellulales bacterium]